MRTQEQRTINAAVLALKRTTGIDAHVHPAVGRNRGADAIVEVETERRKYRFGAEVKTVDRFEIPALVKAQGCALPESPVLVAPYITREVAERCRQLHLPFIDTAGNAYLEGPGLLVYVAGQARPAGLRQDRFRALNPAGLQIAFAVLCGADLIRTNYREIAARAGVALGTVGPVMKDLEARGLLRFQTKKDRKLLDPQRLLEEWVTHYPVTLRPKLNPRRLQADPERLQKADLTQQNAYWGGEPAAEKLTQYLRPAHFTIYAREPIAKLIAATRMRADGTGNVEILDVFWNFDPDKGFPDVVPPVLAYADLLATDDGRDAEAARMIYEQRIAPAFRSAG
ncbi:MAG: type IV toxin-antitoxin system AbiEi family antitoxin [Bryobacteraceae bacterium]|jgi:hypothetical protein